MKTEELTALGLTEEQAKSVLAMNGRDIERNKKDAEALRTQLGTAQKQLGDANSKLEGYDPEWKAKSEKAQQDAEAQIAALRRAHAIEAGIAERKGRNVRAIRALIDEAAVTVNDKGEVIGLNEQLDRIQASDGFLFESDKPAPVFSRTTPGAKTTADPDKKAQANAGLRALFGKEG